MTVAEADFELVRLLMYVDAGLLLEPDKAYLVETRLQRLARQEGVPVGALLARLRESDEALLRRQVVEAMAIQETYFFRDPWLFDSLRGEVIPALLQRRAPLRRLRIWCAACATGQEVYSLCLLLREHFPELEGWELSIVASDFSEEALGRARAGLYTLPEVNRGLPARMLMRYFSQRGLEWELHKEVRRMVDFRAINLIGEWSDMPLFDIVLLRNVLIYFDTQTRRDVLTRVRGLLSPDGCLFLGGTESPMGLVDGFEPSDNRNSCYYRIQGGG